MAGSSINTLEKDQLLRVIARQGERISNIERMLQGVPIATVRIANASITSAKISDLSADKITTGTLIVKDGAEKANISVLNASDDEIVLIDSDGVTVKDTSGNPIVVLDSAGILVDNGNIVVKNGDGDTVFDVNGLVGMNNFETYSDTLAGAGTFETTSTSEVDITGLDSFTINYTKEIPTLVFVTALMKVDADSGDAEGAGAIRLKIDGSKPADSVDISKYFKRSSGEETGNSWLTMTTHYYCNPSAGDHTFALKAIITHALSGTPEMAIYYLRFTVIKLGK